MDSVYPHSRLIHDYLSNRKQRTKINCSYNEWLEIVFGVPQGSILGSLLFNIHLADLFLIMDDINITNYAWSYLGQNTSGKRVGAQNRRRPNWVIKFSKSRNNW